jgi:hypothetical protein
MRIAEDAKPQLKLLFLATLITTILWFIPYAEWIVYPLRLFVTFIHESSHAIVGLLTGSSIKSLVVFPNGEGVVLLISYNWFSSFLTSSAGYLGTAICGALLLFMIRQKFLAKNILIAIAVFIGIMAFLFGLIVPLFNIFDSTIKFIDIAFTFLTGTLIALALIFLALKCSPEIQNFAVAFLAVQLVLNALFDLKTLFMINAPLIGTNMHTDAANMEKLTGIPAIVWVLIWIGLSVLIISIALRLYVISRRKEI